MNGVLLAWSIRGTGWGLSYSKHHGPSASRTSVETALALFFLYNCRTHFSKNISGNFEEQAVLLTGPGGCIAHRGPHRLWERKRERDRECAALPLLRSKDGVWGFMGHSSLKHESRTQGLVFFQAVRFLGFPQCSKKGTS